jgi:hypothetical protein
MSRLLSDQIPARRSLSACLREESFQIVSAHSHNALRIVEVWVPGRRHSGSWAGVPASA